MINFIKRKIEKELTSEVKNKIQIEVNKIQKCIDSCDNYKQGLACGRMITTFASKYKIYKNGEEYIKPYVDNLRKQVIHIVTCVSYYY